jgi:LysR family hydrogen peroxide-inducible transcriptional activator
MQVKKLEDEVGYKIFDRSSVPLKPTKAGKQFILKARQIIREIKELKEMVSTEIESMEGTFKLSVIPTIGPYLIPKIAGLFAKQFPKTELIIQDSKTAEIFENLKQDKIDIAILSGPIDDSSFREILLYHEPFVFFAKQDHPLMQKKLIEAKDLKNEPQMWLLNKGHCFRNQALEICQNDKKQNIKFESESLESIKQMVLQYEGYTLIPEMAVGENDYYKKLKSPEPSREVCILVNKSFAKEALIENLRKLILSVVPENYEKNERFIRVKWR